MKNHGCASIMNFHLFRDLTQIWVTAQYSKSVSGQEGGESLFIWTSLMAEYYCRIMINFLFGNLFIICFILLHSCFSNWKVSRFWTQVIWTFLEASNFSKKDFSANAFVWSELDIEPCLTSVTTENRHMFVQCGNQFFQTKRFYFIFQIIQ